MGKKEVKLLQRNRATTCIIFGQFLVLAHKRKRHKLTGFKV